jgi:hypothetical protein
MSMDRTLTAQRLREVVDYNPETGEFRWVAVSPYAHRVRIGDVAGTTNNQGYRMIRVDGSGRQAHRLA